MKKLTQLAAGAVLASAAAVVPTTAMAEVSYNIGYASEYYFRGVHQKNSSASAGIDFENGGFYLGSWTADVGEGLEVDVYGGYGMEFDGGLSVSVGLTGYYYTGSFDDKYEEVNLNLGFGIFGLEYSFGEAGYSSASSDYDFLGLTIAPDNGLYATLGFWGDDADGEYVELGYGTTIADLDFGIALIFSSEELNASWDRYQNLDSSGAPVEDEALVLTIGKSF